MPGNNPDAGSGNRVAAVARRSYRVPLMSAVVGELQGDRVVGFPERLDDGLEVVTVLRGDADDISLNLRRDRLELVADALRDLLREVVVDALTELHRLPHAPA